MQKCPECGLGCETQVMPRPGFWSPWRAGLWGLALGLLVLVVAMSVAQIARSSHMYGSLGYPAFLGALGDLPGGAPVQLTTVGDLRRIANGEIAPSFTLKQVIAQASEGGSNPDPGSRLMVLAWTEAPGTVMRKTERGWPWSWQSEAEFRQYKDLRTMQPVPPGLPVGRSTAWSMGGYWITHAGDMSGARVSSYAPMSVLVIMTGAVALALIAGRVTGWIARGRGRDESRCGTVAVRTAVIVLIPVIMAAVAWPANITHVIALADVSKRKETGVKLAELEDMRSAPDAERALARALDTALAAADTDIVLVCYDVGKEGTVYATYLGWPLPVVWWERVERFQPLDEQYEHGWRRGRPGGRPGLVGFVSREKGDPHVMRALTIPVLDALTVVSLIVLPSLALAALHGGYIYHRTSRRRRSGRCVGCGYQLAGLDRTAPASSAGAGT